MGTKEIYKIVEEKLKEHIKPIYNLKNEMIMISNTYKGVWLEHVFDSIMYGILYNDYNIAKNTILNFINYQDEYGQYPYSIKDELGPKYNQIQECVSFIGLAFMIYEKINDNDFLNIIYKSGKRWVDFIYKYRMTRGLNLVEMFVGYDTGHDNSSRLNEMTYKQNYSSDSKICPKSKRTPICALDMSCNLYKTLITLAKIANKLNLEEDNIKYNNLAKEVKESIFRYLYDNDTNYFYDLDSDNNLFKIKSSSIFHLFLEDVLDINEDKELVDNIVNNYLLNEEEFNTNYPIPSISKAEENKIIMDNSWGYYSQALIALRCYLWMDKYNLKDVYDNILKKWVEGLNKNFNINPMAQELDPNSGISTKSSPWYSSSMLLYIYACKRLKLV